MAESRIKGNNRLDPPDKGRSYFDDPFGMNRDNLPIVSSSGNDYALTLNEDGISSLIPVGVNSVPTPININVEPDTAIQFASGSAGNEVLSGSLDFVYDYDTQRVGLGLFNPQAKLHISGANNQSLMRIQSPASSSILFVSGSGNIGINTLAPSAKLHISGASADRLLHVGSPSQANILFVTGIGKVGIGTNNPSQLLSVVDGGNSKLLIGTNVSIQTSALDSWIYLFSDPAGSKYIRIDAAQTSNLPPKYVPTSPANNIYGNTADDYALGTPDHWMEIKLNGNVVLIPCYSPGQYVS